MMLRDFSDASKQKLLGLVSQVENEKYSDFTDWVGDRWYDFEEWIGQLNIRNYINNVNAYHKKVIDKNNATKDAIEKIFQDVNQVNHCYCSNFQNIDQLLGQWLKYIQEMNEIVTPGNGKFDSGYIAGSLQDLYSSLQDNDVDVIKDNMKKEIDGDVEYDMEVIQAYLRKNPEDLSDAEKIALIQIVTELGEMNAQYCSILSMGDEKAAAYVGYLSHYQNGEEAYLNFIAMGAYYNEAYLKVLHLISESSEDKSSFAAQLLNFGNENYDAGIFGLEYTTEVKKFWNVIPKSASVDLTGYILKIKTENKELYAGKVTLEGGIQSSGKVKIKTKFKKEQEDIFKESLVYDPEKGEFRKCGEDEYKKLKEKAKLLGTEARVGVEFSALEGTISGKKEWLNGSVTGSGSVTAKVGTASADASFGAGLYVYDKSGNKILAPTVNAEVGASVSAVSISANGEFGNEYVGVYGKGSASALEAEAKANAKFTVFDEKGQLNIQGGVSASAEANLVEASGSTGVTVLGAEMGVSGSVKVGIGAHADVGFVDGHLKVDIGAAVGLGVSVGFDVDVGGLIDGVGTKVAESWSGISAAASEGWNSLMSIFR